VGDGRTSVGAVQSARESWCLSGLASDLVRSIVATGFGSEEQRGDAADCGERAKHRTLDIVDTRTAA